MLAENLAPAHHNATDLRHDGAGCATTRHNHTDAICTALDTTIKGGYDRRSASDLQDCSIR